MIVNVAISKSSDEEKFGNSCTAHRQARTNTCSCLATSNPLVSLQQYANTLTKMIEMAGFKDPQTFLNTEVPPMPPQPQEQKPDPAALLGTS